jgi:hypothetical protein
MGLDMRFEMKRLIAAFAALLISGAAHAQSGTVTSFAFAVGKGPGTTGFSSVLCGLAQIPIGQTSANPACAALTGDVTMTAGGVTAIGASKVTAAMLASMTSAQLRTILSDEVGTGAAYFVGGALGTPASATLTNATGLPISGLAAIATNTIPGNATAGSASPTALAVPSCSTASSALTWTTNTGFGCNSIAGGGSGAWSNTRLAKTAAYAAVTGDCGATIALGGTAGYGVTFNAPSGYAANCAFLVRNEDRARGKFIYPQFASSSTSLAVGMGAKVFTTSAGLTVSTTERYRVYSLANPSNFMAGTASYSGTTFTLTTDITGGGGTFTDWQIAPEVRMAPGTERWVYNQNNVWLLDPRKRWLTPGRGNVYELCVRQDGNDSADGFGDGTVAADCLAGIQTAVNIIGTEWDGSGYNSCAVGLYAGGTSTLASAATQTGESIGCYLTYNVRGAVKINGAGSCFNNGDGAISIWNWNLGFVPTFACNTGNVLTFAVFKGHQTSVYDFNGGTAIWIPGGVTGLGTGGTKGTNDRFLDLDLQGSLTFNATVNVGNGVDTFNPNTFAACEAHCSKMTLSGSVASSANVNFAVALALSSGSVIVSSLTWPGSTATNPTTPTGFSVFIKNGTTIPGGVLPASGFPAQNSFFGLVTDTAL